MDTYFYGFLASALGIIGAAPYIYNTYRKKTKPHRFAWLIFLTLSVLLFASQLALGARSSLIFVGWTVVNNLIIFGLSLRKNAGYGDISIVNIISLALAVTSIVLWRVTDSPLIALVCLLIADGIGAMLIVVKTYKHPHTETIFMWSLGILAGILGMFAVGTLDYSLLAYPFYIALLNFMIVAAAVVGAHIHNGANRHH